MIRCIAREIELVENDLPDDHLSGIYFGGGTPSLLDQVELDLLIKALLAKYSWYETAEITLEANPDDIHVEKLKAWRDAGVNRLSIGIQSFLDKDLQWMNRAHNAHEAERSLEMAKQEGFDNLTIDLIYGTPGSTMEDWEYNIDKALGFGIDHISAYCLTIEEGTALAHFVKKGKYPDVDQENAIKQFDLLIDRLKEHGFDHYEVSNFARNGRYSVHNSSYWKGLPYLGFGPGAHSYDGGTRRWNISNNMKYIRSIEQDIVPFEEEVLSEIDKYNEYIITRLRTKWGVKTADIPESLTDHFQLHLEKAIRDDLIISKGDAFVLTRKGIHFADRVSMNLMHDT